MGLEKVIEEVLERGRLEAENIINSGKVEADSIREQAHLKRLEIISKMSESVKDRISRMRQQELSTAELESKRIRLNTEKELLDLVYQKCIEEIRSLSTEKKRKILECLIARATGDIPDGYIYSNKEDMDLVKGATVLKYAGNIDCIGGIVVENLDRTIRIDLRFETLLETLWNKKLKEIADILFR